MCSRPFDKVTVIRSDDHIIPQGWFNGPRPDNLPTWKVCLDCQRDLSPREERLRNTFVYANSHAPDEVQDIYDRSGRSTRAPKVTGRKLVTHPGGFEVSADIAIPNQLDLHLVFAKIAVGLYWYREGKLPTDRRFEVRIPNAADFDKWTRILMESCPVQRLSAEFGWMSAHNREEGDWNVWLFNVFNAVPVGVWHGNAVNFPLPHPSGVVLRDDAPYVTPGLITV